MELIAHQLLTAFRQPVPAGVRDQRRQDDGADPLGRAEAEEQLEQRNQRGQDDQLADLDADVEGEQRGEDVRSGGT